VSQVVPNTGKSIDVNDVNVLKNSVTMCVNDDNIGPNVEQTTILKHHPYPHAPSQVGSI
jgi:hypothetical protein